jgi:hypothetical protein
MLFTVSTVKDTLANLQRFVAGNLAGGADHLVVFLDAEQPDVQTFLDGHPHVTCVRTDDAWWRGDRPADLNVRQRLNANLVKAVLTRVEGAEWVFHVDADEIVRLDRDVLAAVPASERVVGLLPLEAVSQVHWDGDPTWFKRLLRKPELRRLQELGVIDRAHNGALFHGHVDGKSGIRPTLDLWLTLHQGVDAAGTELERFTDDRLSLLHFESYSGDDFARKWVSILSAGTTPHFRPARRPTADAVLALMGLGLGDDELRARLLEVFRETTEDDLETLRAEGFLVQADWRDGTHQPAAFTGTAREAFDTLMTTVSGAPKRAFQPGGPAAPVEKILDGGGGLLRGARGLLRRS